MKEKAINEDLEAKADNKPTEMPTPQEPPKVQEQKAPQTEDVHEESLKEAIAQTSHRRRSTTLVKLHTKKNLRWRHLDGTSHTSSDMAHCAGCVLYHHIHLQPI